MNFGIGPGKWVEVENGKVLNLYLNDMFCKNANIGIQFWNGDDLTNVVYLTPKIRDMFYDKLLKFLCSSESFIQLYISED